MILCLYFITCDDQSAVLLNYWERIHKWHILEAIHKLDFFEGMRTGSWQRRTENQL